MFQTFDKSIAKSASEIYDDILEVRLNTTLQQHFCFCIDRSQYLFPTWWGSVCFSTEWWSLIPHPSARRNWKSLIWWSVLYRFSTDNEFWAKMGMYSSYLERFYLRQPVWGKEMKQSWYWRRTGWSTSSDFSSKLFQSHFQRWPSYSRYPLWLSTNNRYWTLTSRSKRINGWNFCSVRWENQAELHVAQYNGLMDFIDNRTERPNCQVGLVYIRPSLAVHEP